MFDCSTPTIPAESPRHKYTHCQHTTPTTSQKLPSPHPLCNESSSIDHHYDGIHASTSLRIFFSSSVSISKQTEGETVKLQEKLSRKGVLRITQKFLS
jgi:hypothetical protein